MALKVRLAQHASFTQRKGGSAACTCACMRMRRVFQVARDAWDSWTHAGSGAGMQARAGALGLLGRASNRALVVVRSMHWDRRATGGGGRAGQGSAPTVGGAPEARGGPACRVGTLRAARRHGGVTPPASAGQRQRSCSATPRPHTVGRARGPCSRKSSVRRLVGGWLRAHLASRPPINQQKAMCTRTAQHKEGKPSSMRAPPPGLAAMPTGSNPHTQRSTFDGKPQWPPRPATRNHHQGRPKPPATAVRLVSSAPAPHARARHSPPTHTPKVS